MIDAVNVRREPVVLPTYEPAEPDKNPMFLEKRVYQGSSGRVYPLPFFNRIAEEATDREWDAITIDNGLVEVMLLPEIGGRVHAIRDLTNGYDAIYRQHVIKPALVGLGGPWVSGGIEFNWPQHHRPSTFMPADVFIERGEDGSVTVWMGEHEPMDRTKGMHGICLHPGRSVVEIKVRLYNRTATTQTFLWWTNIGTHVHQGYKSFFPPDAHLVADHAKRALSTYPLCEGRYYGVDYASRGREGIPVDEVPSDFVPKHCGGEGPDYAPNDLSWYANIPVPTSYMCVGTEDDFVGGYDHFAQAGLLHVADHHIAPGKKQWTWGNQEFGYAWDRNLTDSDGPYIELMAGVYTDNQPDFSMIGPGETRTWSQYLYPYRLIGPVQAANVDAAISVTPDRVGIVSTRQIQATILVDDVAHSVLLAPDAPFVTEATDVRCVVVREGDFEVIRYEASEREGKPLEAATEPPLPAEVASSDELFLIGQHLWQYRHATRNPADYWREALRRDPGDLRCNNAMGSWFFRRGEFAQARQCFEAAIQRATRRNPNPTDGEPFYNLGLVLRYLGCDQEAIDAFAKATWNAAWQGPAFHALGELFAKRGETRRSLEYLDKAIRKDADNTRAMDLRAMVRRQLGLEWSVEEVLRLDPMDYWARWLSGQTLEVDNAVRFDLVFDFVRAGFLAEALSLLDGCDLTARDGTAPMVWYTRAWVLRLLGEDPTHAYSEARKASPDWCFPARLEDIAVLEAAPDDDPRAALYLGHLLYDRRRHHEAIAYWRRSAELEPGNSVVHRNLGIAAFNVLGDAELARASYEQAILANPDDARLWFERDQLWKRVGVSPEDRLSSLSLRVDLVEQRDDLTIEYCALLNATGQPDVAAQVLLSRRFQPWEGGEGMALGMFTRTQLALAKRATASEAARLLQQALVPPHSLGEARHILANASDLWLAFGDALAEGGNVCVAEKWWRKAADFRGDFQEMAVQPFSEYTFYQAEAMRRLGRTEEAETLLRDLGTYAKELAQTPAKIDYFATSLPTMLLFDDDLQARQDNRARFLLAQSLLGLGDIEAGRELLSQVLACDPNHALARELLA